MSGRISKPRRVNSIKSSDLSNFESHERPEIITLEEAYEKSKGNRKFYILYMMMLSTVYSLCSLVQHVIPFMVKRPALLCMSHDSDVLKTCDSNQACNSYITYKYVIDYESKETVRNWITSMNLVCEQDYKIGLFGSMYFVGILITSTCLIRLADIIGRRTVAMIGLIGLIISIILMYSINILFIVYVFVTFVGIFNSLRVFSGYILSIELMMPRYRKSLHMTANVIDKFIQIFVTLFIYFKCELKYIVILSIITSIITLLFIYNAPESPEFLYKNQQWDQLHEAFKFISRYESAQWDNCKFEGERNLQITEINIRQNCLEMLKDKKTVRNLVIMCINWSSSVFCSYVILFYCQYLKGSIYIIYIAISISDILARITVRILQSFLETRKIFMICYFLSFMFSLFYFTISDNDFYVVITMMILSWGVYCNFGLCYYGNKEYFHVEFTSTAFGICNVCARSLCVFAPMLDEILPQPIILITVSTSIAFLSSYFLIKLDNEEFCEDQYTTKSKTDVLIRNGDFNSESYKVNSS